MAINNKVNRNILRDKRGAEDSLKNIVIGFLVTIAFGFLILTTVVDMGNKYGKADDVAIGSLDYELFNQTLYDLNDSVENVKTAFQGTNIFNPLTVAGVIVTGIYEASKSLWTIVTVPAQIIMNILANVFGIPTIIVGVLFAVLTIALIFAIWRVVRIGA